MMLAGDANSTLKLFMWSHFLCEISAALRVSVRQQSNA